MRLIATRLLQQSSPKRPEALARVGEAGVPPVHVLAQLQTLRWEAAHHLCRLWAVECKLWIECGPGHRCPRIAA